MDNIEQPKKHKKKHNRSKQLSRACKQTSTSLCGKFEYIQLLFLGPVSDPFLESRREVIFLGVRTACAYPTFKGLSKEPGQMYKRYKGINKNMQHSWSGDGFETEPVCFCCNQTDSSNKHQYCTMQSWDQRRSLNQTSLIMQARFIVCVIRIIYVSYDI